MTNFSNSAYSYFYLICFFKYECIWFDLWNCYKNKNYPNLFNLILPKRFYRFFLNLWKIYSIVFEDKKLFPSFLRHILTINILRVFLPNKYFLNPVFSVRRFIQNHIFLHQFCNLSRCKRKLSFIFKTLAQIEI